MWSAERSEYDQYDLLEVTIHWPNMAPGGKRHVWATAQGAHASTDAPNACGIGEAASESAHLFDPAGTVP
jgi:hypothetical protein